MTVVMTIAGSVGRVARGVLGSVSWRAMPVAVRVLAAVLVTFLAVVVVHLIADVDTPSPVYEPLYNSVLVGSAVLCLARGVFGRSERVAWTLIGVALALWAGGNLYWQFALSELAEAPYPSVADALLARIPSRRLPRRRAAGAQADAAARCPAVARRHHRRADHGRDQRRGRLRRGARVDRRRHRCGGDQPRLSARRHDPARHRHRRHGGRPRPAGPQLAVLRRGHRRLRRHRLDLPPADRQGHLRPRHAARHRMALGHAADGPRRLAARGAQAVHRRRAAQHPRADRARARQPRAAGLRPLRAHQPARADPRQRRARGGAHPPLPDAPREPRQPRQHAPPGAHRRPDRAREPIRAAARARRRGGRAGVAPAADVRSRRLQELQRLVRASGGRHAAGEARLAPRRRRSPPTAAPTGSVATSSACSPRGRPAGRPSH